MMADEKVTVTVIRPSAVGVDKYGNPVASTPTRTDIPGCLVTLHTSTESIARGDFGSMDGWDVYAPAGSDIRFTDTVELFGGGTTVGAPVTPATAILCRVEGEPADWSLGTVVHTVRA